MQNFVLFYYLSNNHFDHCILGVAAMMIVKVNFVTSVSGGLESRIRAAGCERKHGFDNCTIGYKHGTFDTDGKYATNRQTGECGNDLCNELFTTY